MHAARASGPSSNRILNYQLRLTGSTGVPVADGTKNIKLTVYTAASGGTQLYSACTADGTATGAPTAVVATFAGGQSSILIGSTLTCASGSSPAIPATLFDNVALFLGVTVETDAEMTPRKRIVAAGYSLNADKLDDLETSSTGGTNAFVPVTNATGLLTLTGDPTTSAGVITVNAAAAANELLIDLNTSGVDRFTVDAEGDAVLFGDFSLIGGDLTTTSTLFNLVNATATTVNFAGAATALTIGATTGTMTLRNATVTASGDLAVNGGDLTTTATTFNLLNTTATTLNVGGAATSLNLAGGSGSTGCTIDASGNLACSGTVSGGGGAGVGGTGAAGQAAFWTGASTLAGDNNFFWDNTNKRLGIGTASPTYALDVLSAGNNIIRARNNANTFAAVDIDSGATAADFSVLRLFDRGTNKWELRKNSANNFDIRDVSVPSAPFTIEAGSPTDALYVRASTGNVGIGTATAAEKLEVNGNGKFGVVSVGNTAANFVNLDSQVDGNVLLSSNLSVNDANQLIISNSHAAMSGAGVHIPGNGRPRQGSIEFWTTPTGSVTAGAAYAQSSPRAVIDNIGNMGIGQASPTARLHLTPSANDEAIMVSGYSLTGAATDEMLDLSGTWNTTGAPTGIRLNITDTASSANSELLSLALGGNKRFFVNKTGKTTVQGSSATSSLTNLAVGLHISNSDTTANNLSGISFGDSQAANAFGAIQLQYIDHTSGSEDGDLVFSTANAGTFAERMRLTSAGHLVPGADDTYDLGTNTLRWRDLYLGPATLHIGTATGDEGALTYNTATNVLAIDSTGAIDINGGSGSTGCSVDAAGNFSCSGTVSGGGGAGITGSGAAGQATFWTGTSTVSGDNAFFWDNTNKRLGINTPSPAAKLEVTSGATAVKINSTTGNTTNVNALVIENAGGEDYVKIRNIGTGTGGAELILDGATSGVGKGAWVTFQNSGADNWTMGQDIGAAGDLGFFIASGAQLTTNRKFYVTQAGNVGIGDTSPASLLTVGNGDLFQVNSSGAIAASTGLTLTSSATTTNAASITANSLTQGKALVVTATGGALSTGRAFEVNASLNSAAAAGAFTFASQFNVTNAQTTNINTAHGIEVNWTQNASVSSSERLLNLKVAQNDSAPSDNGVIAALNIENLDTATGNQISLSNGILLNGANVANGINFSGTFGTNYVTSTNWTVSQAGSETLAGDLAVNGGDLTTTAATFNLAAAATTVTIAGGSGSTGCTVDGSGNLSCSGTITGGGGAGLTGSGTAGQATFWTGTSSVSGDNAFFWDNANKRLGIGNAAPSVPLHVTGRQIIDAGSPGGGVFGLTVNGTLGSFGPGILLDNGSQSWGIAAGLAASDFIVTKSSGTSFTPFTIKNTSFQDALVLGTTGVGIGTASPGDRLEVVGSGTAIRATDGSVVTRLFSSSSTGSGYVGTNSSNNFVLRTGGADRWTVDTSGDLLPQATSESIIFPAQTGDNTIGEIIMFNGCCSNGRRAIIGHSPGFDDWGLSYDDTNDDFYFATGLTATPELAIDMGSASVYFGSTVSGTGASIHRSSIGNLSGSQSNGWQPDSVGSPGIWLEDAGSEGGGFFANGNTAVVYSPGDGTGGILSVYDEDVLSSGGAPGATPGLRVQNGGMLSVQSLAGGGTTLCYNTGTFSGMNTLSNCVSSRKYKENIRPFDIDVSKVLALQPVRFDWKRVRHPEHRDPQGKVTPGWDEQYSGPPVGLIAEDVAPLLPDIVTYKEGQIEGIEYKLLPIYELAVLKKHEADIEALKLGAGISTNGTMTVNELNADVVRSRAYVVKNAGANRTAGSGVIPADAGTVTLQNANVAEGSLINITFKDDPGARWWISQQAAGSFTVRLSSPNATAVRFTYWVVGVQEGNAP